MGNQPRKYAYISEESDVKRFIALSLGFDNFSRKFKVKRGDTALFIGEFNLDLLPLLPPCTLIILDKNANPSPLLPYKSSKDKRGEDKVEVECLRIRSDYSNFHTLFLAALREYEIQGSTLERLREILNSTILNWIYNGGQEKRFGKLKPVSPASFYMEANTPEIFSFII